MPEAYHYRWKVRQGTKLTRETQIQPLFTDTFLLAEWADEYEAYDDNSDAPVLKHLSDWAERDSRQTETQLQGSFVETILCRLLGFWTTGGTASTVSREIGDWQSPIQTYTAHPEFPVPNAGQRGGTGSADVALGLFGHNDNAISTRGGQPWNGIPQVLGEFKDIRSGLDVPQNRKDNDRSPVGQCFDYLKHAFDQTPTNVPLKPTWGLVTDMVEFRLYSRTHGQAKCQRFVIDTSDLLAQTDKGRCRRFLFRKIFSPTQLLSHRAFSPLAKLLDGQITQQRTLEKTFYLEYKAYRERVYEAIVECNPNFEGSRGDLVTLTQRFLDRCLFVLFCEDMGRTVGFPPRLLQEMLAEQSVQNTYSPSLKTIWPLVSALFAAMRDGGDFPPDHKIERFNGGLFAEDQRLDRLIIPNHVFCAKGQGVNEESLMRDKATLLYLAATYNFGEGAGDAGDGKSGSDRTITLYTLGRIFEQSITELEYLHAQAENRDTPAKLAKRKRDGVYYTPEWVTTYIVQETVGRRLRDEQERLGLELGADLPGSQISRYRSGGRAKTGKTSVADVVEHLHKLGTYRSFVDHLTILDPACGSGAFLITALLYLRQHYRDLVVEEQRITGVEGLFDQDAIVRSILANNLYGVDINPESIEITQLALWLHTATKGQPLTTLDHHIRCGNSLVGSDFAAFYKAKHRTLFDDLSRDEQELVNVFDWSEAFPEIFGEEVSEDQRGFDCIVGNPPYVKLQHMRKMKEDEVLYLMEQNKPGLGGAPLYRSTRTGNFDLYLPFIERGISFLNSTGRMGYIAPNVWLKNEYGESLKKLIAEQGTLDRWVDFGHFQVFDDVTVYTALQFFSRRPRDAVAFHRINGNKLAELDWNESTPNLPYRDLRADAPWLLLDIKERRLEERATTRFPTMENERVSIAIFQGVKTSADEIFVFVKDRDGSYWSSASGQAARVELETEMLRPVASGTGVSRYLLSPAEDYLLYPYKQSVESAPLIDWVDIETRYPKIAVYYRANEEALRKREERRFDGPDWYGFSRPQNLTKQPRPKLLVAGTSTGLHLSFDETGSRSTLGGRVYSVLSGTETDEPYLLGILNSPVANYFFKVHARPKANGYFDAETAFINRVPVPIPCNEVQQSIGAAAKSLQELHTKRRDDIAAFEKRVASPQCLPDVKPLDWLWADANIEQIKATAPAGLNRRDATSWAKKSQQEKLERHYEPIDAVLVPDASFDVVAESGDLYLRFGDLELLTKYAPDQPAEYIAALWRHKLRTNRITPGMNAKKLVGLLLDLRTATDDGLRQSLVKRDADLADLEAKIATAEAAMNNEIFGLYELTEEEREIIQQYGSHIA